MKADKELVYNSIKSLQEIKLREVFRLQKIRNEKRKLIQEELECLTRLQNVHKKIYWELSNNQELLSDDDLRDLQE